MAGRGNRHVECSEEERSGDLEDLKKGTVK